MYYTRCIQLICHIALIAAGSDDDMLLLAMRYFATAQIESSILAIATHMSNECIVSLQLLSFNIN